MEPPTFQSQIFAYTHSSLPQKDMMTKCDPYPKKNLKRNMINCPKVKETSAKYINFEIKTKMWVCIRLKGARTNK